jgi:hypothetical protein
MSKNLSTSLDFKKVILGFISSLIQNYEQRKDDQDGEHMDLKNSLDDLGSLQIDNIVVPSIDLSEDQLIYTAILCQMGKE